MAAPPAAAPPKAVAAPRVIPDYGGRDSDIASTLDRSGAASAVNPAAQAGRAFEALVVVLAVVIGGLLLLKKSGLIKGGEGDSTADGPAWSFLNWGRRSSSAETPSGAATTELLSLLGSQSLPQSGGARLHLVSVGGRLLLLGATPQSVTLLTEVAHIGDAPDSLQIAEPDSPLPESPEDAAAFAQYLERVGVEPPPATLGKAVEANLAAAAGRLRSLMRPPDRS